MMNKKTFPRLSTLSVCIALVCYTQFVLAEEAVTFNTDVLDATDRKNVDLTKFAEGNYVVPGKYLLDVRINGQELSQRQIVYKVDPRDSNKTVACLSHEQVALLALKEDSQQKLVALGDDCADVTSLPGAKVNNQSGVLDITVPQAWMKYSDPDWVPPERWDNGVAGVIFDYNLTGQINRYQDGDDYKSVSGYGQTGFNAGAWRVRGEYQSEFDSSNHSNTFDWNRIYAYRPLPMQAAKLTMGEIYLDSQIFDSVRFTGVNLASDERMLPPNLQGYAPEIKGIANSNARVTVSQSGHIINQTTVPAGPFNIQDLRSSVRGTLDVKIEEQDGSTHSFQVNTANIPYLTRPGYVRYNTSVGRPSRYNHDLQGPMFYTGDFSWGVSNAWSLYGGTIFTGDRYNAWSLGLGRDLSTIGALSFDITQSMSRVRDQQQQKGMSFKLSYAKTFDEYNSSITFAGYRFSQKNFRSLTQYLDEQYQDYSNNYREKEMFTVTANKTLWADDPQRSVTFYLTYTHQNYWGSDSQDRYGLSVGHSFSIAGIDDITANLSAYRSEYHGENDDSMALNVSIPWGDSRWVGYDLQSNHSNVSQMASYSDNRDVNNTWRLRAGSTDQHKASFDSYYQHNAPMAQMEANFSYQQGNYTSLGGTLRGGFTATRHGAALHNSNASTDAARVMVDTDGVAGVPLNGDRVHSNGFGIAVVPDIVSYNSFDTRIDVDQMNDDVEASNAIATSTLTEGAIGFQHFDVAQGEKIMARLALKSGATPPFGAEVFNQDGVSVSMVMENGLAYIAGIKPDETLSVVWGGKTQCSLHLPHTVSRQGSLLLPCN